jgi:SAM-dependent methyltransferase
MQLGSSGFRVDGLDVEHNPETIEEFKKKDGLQTRIWRGLENVSTSFLFYEGVMLPFDDQCFDAVVAHAVVEHISPNVVSSLFQEIKRVLKPCGYFFLFRTPRKQALTEHMARTLHMGSHNKLMGEQELISMLTMNGFEVISFRRTDLVFGVLRGRMQNIWNLMSPALLMVDEMLLETPLSRLAHHMQVVCQKPVESKVK